MADAAWDISAPRAEDDRRALIGAAVEESARQVADRVRATAEKREAWQASVNDLLRQSGRGETAGSGVSGSAGVDALPAMEAGAGRLAGFVQRCEAGDDAAEGMVAAVAAAAGEVRGRSGRGVVHDFDRVFVAGRNCLLEALDGPAEQAGSEAIVALAERVLSEEEAGHAALSRLVRDSGGLLDDLADAAAREVAYAVLGHLGVVLLIRLVRELVEELVVLAGGGAAGGKGRQAVAEIGRWVDGRIAAGRMPPLKDRLRIVVHGQVRAQGRWRAKAASVGLVRRHQVVYFLEKRRKGVRAWWVDGDGAFREGWMKASYVKEL